MFALQTQAVAHTPVLTPRVVSTTIPVDIIFAYCNDTRPDGLTPGEFAVIARGFRASKDAPMRDEVLARVATFGGAEHRRAADRALTACIAKGYVRKYQQQCADLYMRPVYHRTYASKYMEVLDCPELDAWTIPFVLFMAMQVSPRGRGGVFRTLQQWANFLRVSRSSIQVAMADLVARGLVVVSPQSAAWVTRDWRIREDLQASSHTPFLRLATERNPITPKNQRQAVKVPTPATPGSFANIPGPPKPGAPKQDLVAKAMQSAVLGTPDSGGDGKVRREVREAYNAWAQAPQPLEELGLDTATRVVLGRFATMSSHLAQRPIAVTAKHFHAVREILVWLAQLEPREDDDHRSHYLKGWVAGKPFTYAFNAVTALFSAGFTGFTYDPAVIFRAGPHNHFDRFAIDALRKLENKTGLQKSKNPRTDGHSLLQVEALLRAQLQAAGVEVASLPAAVTGTQSAVDKVNELIKSRFSAVKS